MGRTRGGSGLSAQKGHELPKTGELGAGRGEGGSVWKWAEHAFNCSGTALAQKRGLLDPNTRFLPSLHLSHWHLGKALAMQKVKHGKGFYPPGLPDNGEVWSEKSHG